MQSGTLGIAFALAVTLSACSAYSPSGLASGATLTDATTSMGRPTGEYSLPEGGKRLEFARGPFGKHTYMLDFDGSGHLFATKQVLTEPQFNGVGVGMTRDDVLMALGHPSDVQSIPRQARTMWSYRYEVPVCQWFQVGLDTAGRVVDTGYGPDPMCDHNESRDER